VNSAYGSPPLLEVQNLQVSAGLPREKIIVSDFTAEFYPAEITGIIGESGSGKTLTTQAFARLRRDINVTAQTLRFGDNDLMKLDEHGLRLLRGRQIGYIAQNPAQSLSPYERIRRQLARVALRAGGENSENVAAALREAGISDASAVMDRYPYQLSGGLSQRVMIAIMLIMKPALVIADEPTSSIDASLTSQILRQFSTLPEVHGTSLVVITHDFSVIRRICSQVIVMYGGLIMESGGFRDIAESAQHPYTRALVDCSISLSSAPAGTALPGIPVLQPDLNPAECGCPFAPRCELATVRCIRHRPPLERRGRRMLRCHHRTLDESGPGLIAELER
jgi:oligopeptide/dipeptide ABC transporter ATP-binding protein